jgi:hypothetical protein
VRFQVFKAASMKMTVFWDVHGGEDGDDFLGFGAV